MFTRHLYEITHRHYKTLTLLAHVRPFLPLPPPPPFRLSLSLLFQVRFEMPMPIAAVLWNEWNGNHASGASPPPLSLLLLVFESIHSIAWPVTMIILVRVLERD